MKNSYSILWFDDDERSQSRFQRRLTKQLRELGFGLEVDYHKSVNNEIIETLCQQMRVYNKYDLIMFDHKLEGGFKGAHFASIFRQKKIFTDMVYYSTADANILWQALRKGHVDGAYILNRDGMDKDLIRIVKEQVARVFDVNNMRGFILQFMSQVEGALRSLLVKEMEGATDETAKEKVSRVREMIVEGETSVASKKIKDVAKWTDLKCREAVSSGVVPFDRIRTILTKLRTADKSHLDQDSLLCAIQKMRNVFAHRRHRIDETTHRLYLEGDRTHRDGYSAEDFKDLRVQLMELAEELEPIIGKFW